MSVASCDSLISSLEKNPLFPALSNILMECAKTEPPAPLQPVCVPSVATVVPLLSETDFLSAHRDTGEGIGMEQSQQGQAQGQGQGQATVNGNDTLVALYRDYVSKYHDIERNTNNICNTIQQHLQQRSVRIRTLDPAECEYRCSIIFSAMNALKQELDALATGRGGAGAGAGAGAGGGPRSRPRARARAPGAGAGAGAGAGGQAQSASDVKSAHGSGSGSVSGSGSGGEPDRELERDRDRDRESQANKKARKKRGTLRKAAVDTLKQWLFNHFAHPYPTDDEKQQLSQATGLKVSQVNYWFINARVRIWRPLLESMEGKKT